MKSQRGPVQESNLLADKIEQKLVQIRPFLPAIAGLIGVCVLVMIGYGIYGTQRETRAARAWTEFYFSDTQVQDLETIAKDFEDTSAGWWARMTSGDRSMAQAMEKWNVDRAIADQRFQEAADDYRLVANQATDPFVKSRGLFGLAQAFEGLGQRTEAVDAYREITALSGLPTEYLAEVNARITWLEGKEGEGFYVWYNERRNSAPPPSDGTPPQGLPSLPDLSFPPLAPLSDGSPQPAVPASGEEPPKSEDKP